MHDLVLNHKVVYDFSTLRYACCNAIGQMSTDFAPVFEKKFHARVIPGRLLAVNAFSLSLFLLLICFPPRTPSPDDGLGQPPSSSSQWCCLG